MTKTNPSNLKFSPFGDRVVIERVVTPNMSPGGLHLPKAGQEKPIEGTIVAIGNQSALGLAVGDRVFFGKYAGQEIELQGTLFLVLREGEILGRSEESPAELARRMLTGPAPDPENEALPLRGGNVDRARASDPQSMFDDQSH